MNEGIRMKGYAEISRLIRWIAQECEWQGVTPNKVGYMLDAYDLLSEYQELSVPLIQELGSMIEPELNVSGQWRKVNVTIGSYVPPPWDRVERLMSIWLQDGQYISSPTQLYKEFEEIHPFKDGNGRVGALLFNWWGATLEPFDLLFPPNLWNDSRREGVTL